MTEHNISPEIWEKVVNLEQELENREKQDGQK